MQILTNNDNNILVSINQSSFDTESLAQKMEGTFVNDCAKDIIHIVDNTQTPSTLLSTSTEFTRFPETTVVGNLHIKNKIIIKIKRPKPKIVTTDDSIILSNILTPSMNMNVNMNSNSKTKKKKTEKSIIDKTKLWEIFDIDKKELDNL